MEKEELLKEFYFKMLSTSESIIDFGKEQIPDYIDQLLYYDMVECLVWSFGFFSLDLIILISIFLFNKKEFNDYEAGGKTALIVITALITFMPFIFGVANALDAIKIKVAPKVYVVEYINKQIKGN